MANRTLAAILDEQPVEIHFITADGAPFELFPPHEATAEFSYSGYWGRWIATTRRKAREVCSRYPSLTAVHVNGTVYHHAGTPIRPVHPPQ